MGNVGTTMTRTSAIGSIILALALSACTAKAPDGCKAHTGDGICVDNAVVANGS